MKKTTAYYEDRNKKVAKARSEAWRQKLVQGKLDSLQNPSRLKLERVRQKLPQENIATKSGLTLTYYGMIERGTRTASKEQALRIAKSVGGSVKNYFLPKGEKFVVIK